MSLDLRGVKDIVAVDQNKFCARFIEETSTKFGLNIEIDVIKMYLTFFKNRLNNL